ncbi:hypothetical protein MTsPCn9_10540 [Croceitalea sp. MTPC9]|uniref:conjugal transfer protein n=1 Tax=unclassified Croceitalea TaxID=2632280 RepID=UPI002B391A41|nr:hypothetical protein MTsPCn6_26700 [Croceitalea sp. MTPC6]GMN16118.1 hypothetical protein MTsPCn9_10540 [Croceitalea sp. MTPC9]
MRKNTRTLIVITLFFLIPKGHGVAQGMPVYDNTNFVSLIKQLVEAGKQTAEMLKMVNHLKEVKEKLEKVNNAVKQYKAVREINRNNQELLDMVNRDLREILNSPYIEPQEIDAVSGSFNTIIETSLDNLEFMGQVLSNDFLNMSDGERLEILEAQKEESQKMVADIQLKNKRYRMVISFREMQAKINNRETNY